MDGGAVAGPSSLLLTGPSVESSSNSQQLAPSPSPSDAAPYSSAADSIRSGDAEPDADAGADFGADGTLAFADAADDRSPPRLPHDQQQQHQQQQQQPSMGSNAAD